MKWVKKRPKIKINQNDNLITQLRKMRGIEKEDLMEYLNPTRKQLFDPQKLKNVIEASERIAYALDNNEKIIVSADPDVDGVCSTAIMVRYLRERAKDEHLIDYIYAQRNWGHGIGEQLALKQIDLEEITDIDELEDDNVREINARKNIEKISEANLLIIVDSSSNDADAVEYIINELETDVIIIDHHEIDEAEKYVYDVGAILVNPSQPKDKYPNKSLSGAGVVWKTIQVLEDCFYDGSVDVDAYIDLVGVGIYSDIMDMSVLENRYLVSESLRNFNNVGLVRIIAGDKNADILHMDGDTIGFTIAPLISGSARMNCIEDAIELLLTDDDSVAKTIRLRMHKRNEQRKKIQQELAEKFSQDVDTSKKIIIIADEESNKGFNGLIAQQLAEKYKRPVIVGRLHDGKIMGSGRSFNKFPLRTFLNESGLVDFATGHEGAMGVGFDIDKLELLYDYIDKNMPTEALSEPVIYYDIELSSEDLHKYIDDIVNFNYITGNNARKIIVRINDVMVDERKVLGANNNTIKFTTMDEELNLIKFRTTENYAEEVDVMDNLNVVGELRWNIWRQFRPQFKEIKTMQVMIEDYEIN